MKVIKGYGAPNAETIGDVNDFYVDLDTNNAYRCTSVKTIGEEWGSVTLYASALDNTVYEWGPIGGDEYESQLSGVIDGTLTKLIVPGSVNAIRDYCFQYYGSLASVEILDGVKVIGEHAFEQCKNITELKLADSIEEIKHDAFAFINQLNSLTLPNNLKTIGETAFYSVNIPGHLHIPASVETIGSSAFYDNGLITEITFDGRPTTIESAFSGCPKLQTINVPWAEGEVANAPWGATKATINYNYTGE